MFLAALQRKDTIINLSKSLCKALISRMKLIAPKSGGLTKATYIRQALLDLNKEQTKSFSKKSKVQSKTKSFTLKSSNKKRELEVYSTTTTSTPSKKAKHEARYDFPIVMSKYQFCSSSKKAESSIQFGKPPKALMESQLVRLKSQCLDSQRLLTV